VTKLTLNTTTGTIKCVVLLLFLHKSENKQAVRVDLSIYHPCKCNFFKPFDIIGSLLSSAIKIKKAIKINSYKNNWPSIPLT